MDGVEGLGYGFILGMIFVFVMLFALGFFSGVHISQETANQVCFEITGEDSIAIDDGSRLGWSKNFICKINREEDKSNIIIKKE